MKPRSLHKIISQISLRHLQAALSSLGHLSRSPIATLVTCIVIGVTLAIPIALFVLLKNVDVLGDKLQQSTQMSVYLKLDTNEYQVERIVKTLQENPDIKAVRAISPNEGLTELQQQAGVTNILAELNSNPIPWAINIQPNPQKQSLTELTQLSETLKDIPEVETTQLDSLWVERFFALINLSHHFIYAFAFFLSLAVLLIVNNCIRAATQFHQKEIDIIKLIGGTRSFIRRPFLYAGMIYGLLGGIIAWQFVDLLLMWLQRPLKHLVNLYHNDFLLIGLNVHESFLLLGISMLLGWFGSWFAVTRYLHSRHT